MLSNSRIQSVVSHKPAVNRNRLDELLIRNKIVSERSETAREPGKKQPGSLIVERDT